VSGQRRRAAHSRWAVVVSITVRVLGVVAFAVGMTAGAIVGIKLYDRPKDGNP